MSIGDRFRQLFKPSIHGIEELEKELTGSATNVRYSEEKFEKKCKEWKEGMIKRIPSMTEAERQKQNERASLALNTWNDVNMVVLKATPLIEKKYQIARQSVKDYQEAIRKSLKK